MATGLIAILPQAERARPLLAAIPEVSEERKDPGALSGAIEVSHVRFRYAPDGPLILDDAWEAATQVGLADDIRAMPMGMQTVIMEGGGALSGGQMQRLMIARAIVNRPKVLLLDEATSALDNRTQAVVTESLDRLQVTRVVVAHRLTTAVNADCIYVMGGGRIIESGDYETVMQANRQFARLAARQMV